MIFFEARKLLKTAFWDFILTVLVAGLLFSVGDIFVLTTVNLVSITSKLKKESTLEIFLVDGITPDGIDTLKSMVSGFDGVVEIRDKSPKQALDEMSSILGSDLIEILGHNPLPHCLEVMFKPESFDVEYLNSLSAELAACDEVLEVHFASDWLQRLRKATTVSIVVAILLSAMISAGALFVFVNMQRHIALNRRFVTRNLKLLGIDPWVLRSSCVIPTALAGLLSGLLAISISAALWHLFCRHVAYVPFIPSDVMAITLAIPVMLAIISALASGTPKGKAISV